MKKIILITAILTVLLSRNTKAQTFTGQYHAVTNEHFKQGIKTSLSTKFKSGSINVSSQTIKVDTEAYTVLKTGNTIAADENQFEKPLLVVTTTKKGGYKVMDCILLLKADKSIAQVIFKKTKASTVSYIIN